MPFATIVFTIEIAYAFYKISLTVYFCSTVYLVGLFCQFICATFGIFTLTLALALIASYHMYVSMYVHVYISMVDRIPH